MKMEILKCSKKTYLLFYTLFSVILFSYSVRSIADHLNENTEYITINHLNGEIVGNILPSVPGDGVSASRVGYKLKLFKGKVSPSNKDVYFVITDTNNREFANRFGVLYSEVLSNATPEAIESAEFIDDGADGEWTFFSTPGRITRNVNGEIRPPLSNQSYSPLKEITFDPDGSGSEPPIQIFVNVPFIKWGDAAGQTLLVDKGGCDQLIRKNPPSDLFEGNGPPGCENDPIDDPLARYYGGQVIDLDITDTGGTVTMKLHKGTFKIEAGHSVYYMVFESSKPGAAGFMGVIHAPKLGNLNRGKDIVGTVTQFGNGVADPAGGPGRFQHGMISYPASDAFYTPMWHIRWIFWDLDQDGDGVADGIVLDNECNQSLSDIEDPSLCGNTEAPNISFDPYQLRNSHGDSIKDVAFSENDPILLDSRVLPDGTLPSLVNMLRLINRNQLFLLTDSPGGLEYDRSNSPHIVNCPSPVSTIPIGAELVPRECRGNRTCPDGYTCVQTHGQHGLCYNFEL